MEQLYFYYNMNISFNFPVSKHRFSLRCLPRDTLRQRVESISLDMTSPTWQSRDTDSFGNGIINGCIDVNHENFYVTVEGRVKSGLDILEETSESVNDKIFLAQTPLTKPSDELKDYCKTLLPVSLDKNEYDFVLRLMRELHENMIYSPGTTTIGTTAAQAFSQKTGVCQDYAHIMLSLCRIAGLPARYVVGLINGEGESHAWVEVLCNGVWYGFDPTNSLLVNSEYIKLSHGRDYNDCIICRGIFCGLAQQKQSISVIVKSEQG